MAWPVGRTFLDGDGSVGVGRLRKLFAVSLLRKARLGTVSRFVWFWQSLVPSCLGNSRGAGEQAIQSRHRCQSGILEEVVDVLRK